MEVGQDQAALEIAIDEARTVIDHQIDLAERIERETIRIIYITLLVLGAFLPALQFLLQSLATPTTPLVVTWVSVAAVLLMTTFFAATLAYRSKLFYGGYEDSPTMNWRVLANVDLGEPGSAIPDVRELDIHLTEDEFKKRLLWDYARGIRHNNLETEHRYRMHNDISRLLITALGIFVLGVAFLMMGQPELLWPLLIVGGILSSYVLWATWEDYSTLQNRESDPERFSYDDYRDHHVLDRSDWRSIDET